MNSTNDEDAVAQVIRLRRTVHEFKREVPPREVLLRAIDVARWAPNHRHTEPWRFHLLGPKAVQAVIELNTELVTRKKGPEAGAKKRERWGEIPGWVAVTCPRSDDPVRNEEDYAACCCAIQNLSLYLWTLGIGVKWSTGDVVRHEDFYHLLQLEPNEHRVVALLWYGYPEQIPEQRRKPVAEIVHEVP